MNVPPGMNESMIELIKEQIPVDHYSDTEREFMAFDMYKTLRMEFSQMNDKTTLRLVNVAEIVIADMPPIIWDNIHRNDRPGVIARLARLFCVGKGRLWRAGYEMGPPPYAPRYERRLQLRRWGARFPARAGRYAPGPEMPVMIEIALAYDALNDMMYVNLPGSRGQR